ncbi:MAG: hypothetical protein Q4C50_03280 [Eubacteriales bacterium]|nr:hypothetical protein [Eubacteriales bacterium]
MGYLNEIEDMKSASAKLSNAIRAASALWKDKQFEDLSASVSGVGRMLRTVLEAGERSRRSIEEFDRIANERY